MSSSLVVATAQSSISADVSENGRNIRTLMRKARDAGADLVHFLEGALSGYVKGQIRDWQQVDWLALDEELVRTAELAGKLGLWVVVGSNHRLPAPYRPHNSLYVISADGLIHGRYDKRWCSHTEISDWDTPGTEAFVFEVGGLRFGCALCIEIQFPEVFMDYLLRDVHCVLLSSYSDTPMFGIQAQGYAARHNFWSSLPVPAGMSKDLPSILVGPSGQVVGQCRNLEQSLTVDTLDIAAPEWDIALNKARPWRAVAREGSIYRSKLFPDG